MDIYRLNIMVSIILFEKNLSCCCSNFYYLLSSLKLFLFIFKGLMAIINNNRPIHDIKCLNWMGKFNSIVSNDKSIELGKTFASKIEIIDAIGTHAIPKQSYILTFDEILQFIYDHPYVRKKNGGRGCCFVVIEKIFIVTFFFFCSLQK